MRRRLRACFVFVSLLVAFGSAACNRDPRAVAQRHLDRGNRYLSENKVAEAVIEFRNAVQRDPRLGAAHERLGDALRQAGDRAGAIREYVLAADLLPQDGRLQVKAGNALLGSGRFDDAKARAEKALKADPRNVDAQIVIANALAGLNDLDGAVAQVEEALKVAPDQSGAYANLGALELSRGRYDEAERAFVKAATLQPDSARAQLALGTFYWLNAQFPEAERSLTRALSLDPRSVLVNRALATFYQSTRHPERAEQFLRAIVDITHASDATLALADYYHAVGRSQNERDVLQSLLRDPRASTSANARLAALDAQDGRPDEAFRRLRAVLERDPQNLQALVVKTTLLLDTGKPDEALAVATAATQVHAESPLAWFVLGRTQWARKQIDAAAAAFEQVLRLNPRTLQAKVALAQLQLAKGRSEASIQLSSEALVNDPASGAARVMLVRGLLARGELDLAATELKLLRTRFPESPAVHTQTGLLLGRRNDSAGARKEFERALELNPGEVEALGGLVALDIAAKDYIAARKRVNDRLAVKRDAITLTLAARIETVSGDREAAGRLLREAISRDQAYMPAYRLLGQHYMAQGEFAAAQAEFQKLANQSAKPVAELTMIGILLQAQGKPEQARAQFERALQIDPDAAVAANNLAWMYVETGGNLNVALRLAKTAQKRLPATPEVNDTVGCIYERLGLAKLAIATLKLATEEDPGNALYRYHLASAYTTVGDRIHAEESLKRALALNPTLVPAREALSRLGNMEPTP